MNRNGRLSVGDHCACLFVATPQGRVIYRLCWAHYLQALTKLFHRRPDWSDALTLD